MSEPTLLILAAGIGSRYGSLKQLDRLGPNGETIIDYSVLMPEGQVSEKLFLLFAAVSKKNSTR